MKKILTISFIFSLTQLSLFGQTGNIKFTAIQNPGQSNQILIKAKNSTGSTISGVIGASNITLCVVFPKATTGLTIDISSPITNQLFEPPLKSVFGSDSVYSWNGKGSTAAVDFPSNTEVTVATVTIAGGVANTVSTFKLACLAASGPSGFDYCYIAPGGTEQSGYSNPFYSNIASDPLLINCGGANDVSSMCTSTLGISAGTLPVKFLSFYAIKNGDDAKLTWTVESDENNKYFEIERSTDGRVFQTISKVNALGNGRTVNTYETADAKLSSLGANTVFYRVKQIDKDGSSIYSSIRNLSAVRRGTPVQVYPNPAKTTTRLVFDADQAGKGAILLRDMGGKLVQQINTQFVKGINQLDLNVAKYAAGDYSIQVVGEGYSHQTKLTKIN